jgi:hypothetical protein
LAYTAVESLSDSFKLVCYWIVWNVFVDLFILFMLSQLVAK